MVGKSWARRCFSKHPAVVSASMDRVGHKAVPSRWSLLWKEEPGLCAVVGGVPPSVNATQRDGTVVFCMTNKK